VHEPACGFSGEQLLAVFEFEIVLVDPTAYLGVEVFVGHLVGYFSGRVPTMKQPGVDKSG
jgi:hypothetical protein